MTTTGRGARRRPLALGVVGCARILPAHLRGILAMQAAGFDLFRLTALCARRAEDAAMFTRPGAGPSPRPPASTNESDPLGADHVYVSDIHGDVEPEIFEDWRPMLRSDLVDAVLVLTPVSLHHQVALDALAAGKHVLVEKPFAISVKAGQAIAAEAKRRGLVAGVAESLRYAPRTRALKWVLDEDLIGRPQLWLSAGIGGEWAPDRIVAHTPWRHQKLEGGGGPAIDLGVHLMHQLRYLMGPVQEVSALTSIMEDKRVDPGSGAEVANEVEDVFLAQLRFASGAVGSAVAGWAGHGEGSGFGSNPVIYGSLGCVKGHDVFNDDGFLGTAHELMDDKAPPDVLARFFPGNMRDPFALELFDFGRACLTSGEMEASADEGVLDLAMAYSVLESSCRDAPVTVGDVLSGAVDNYQAEINAHYQL
ncbi:MAG TPA: Gfo/Idh/MocA family oxidoreductase [Acidimicrobiales bacterium]|nr:Gfo/Idh/MocA family oxidoreductase [Acidimicrobiales bacterium]